MERYAVAEIVHCINSAPLQRYTGFEIILFPLSFADTLQTILDYYFELIFFSLN
jgi:hypothetical protein